MNSNKDQRKHLKRRFRCSSLSSAVFHCFSSSFSLGCRCLFAFRFIALLRFHFAFSVVSFRLLLSLVRFRHLTLLFLFFSFFFLLFRVVFRCLVISLFLFRCHPLFTVSIVFHCFPLSLFVFHYLPLFLVVVFFSLVSRSLSLSFVLSRFFLLLSDVSRCPSLSSIVFRCLSVFRCPLCLLSLSLSSIVYRYLPLSLIVCRCLLLFIGPPLSFVVSCYPSFSSIASHRLPLPSTASHCLTSDTANLLLTTPFRDNAERPRTPLAYRF